MCWSSFCHRNNCDPLRPIPCNTSEDVPWCLVPEPLSRVSCEVGSWWIELTFLVNPIDYWLYWDLDTLEAKSTSWTVCHVPQTIPEQFSNFYRVHYSVKRPLPLRSTVAKKGNALAYNNVQIGCTCQGNIQWMPGPKVSQQILSRASRQASLLSPRPSVSLGHPWPCHRCPTMDHFLQVLTNAYWENTTRPAIL